MSKTIKQIADEIGVSKQKVYRYIKANHINEAHQRSGVMYYDESASSIIKQGLIKDTASSEAHHEAHQAASNEAVNEKVLNLFKQELEIKNEQIKDLNNRLSEISSALVMAQQTAATAQALHAGTIQQQLITDGTVAGEDKPTFKDRLKYLFKGER
jgi:predicted transcriptional regulator